MIIPTALVDAEILDGVNTENLGTGCLPCSEISKTRSERELHNRRA